MSGKNSSPSKGEKKTPLLGARGENFFLLYFHRDDIVNYHVSILINRGSHSPSPFMTLEMGNFIPICKQSGKVNQFRWIKIQLKTNIKISWR